MRYQRVGKLIRDLESGNSFDPKSPAFRKRAQEEAVGGKPELYELMFGKPKQKVRMAADNAPPELDGLLQSIREEGKEEALESAIQDATVYLNRQYGIEDQFMAAGLSQPQARMVEALGE